MGRGRDENRRKASEKGKTKGHEQKGGHGRAMQARESITHAHEHARVLVVNTPWYLLLRSSILWLIFPGLFTGRMYCSRAGSGPGDLTRPVRFWKNS